jgi:hypothetical protein
VLRVVVEARRAPRRSPAGLLAGHGVLGDVAGPSDTTVHDAVSALVAGIERRQVDALAPPAAAASGNSAAADSTHVRDFAAWLARAGNLRVLSVVQDGSVRVGGSTATLEIRVWMAWRTGLFGASRHRADAHFRVGFAREHGVWRASGVRLTDRFPPS